MPREPHPWFRQQTGWWMTTIDRQKFKLIKGKDKKAEASKKLRELLTLRDLNPAPDSGELTCTKLEPAASGTTWRTTFSPKAPSCASGLCSWRRTYETVI